MPTIVDFGEELGQVDFGELTQDQLKARPDLVRQVRERLILQKQQANEAATYKDVQPEITAGEKAGSFQALGSSTFLDIVGKGFQGLGRVMTEMPIPMERGEVNPEIRRENVRRFERTPEQVAAEAKQSLGYAAGERVLEQSAQLPVLPGTRESVTGKIVAGVGSSVPALVSVVPAVGVPLASLMYGGAAGESEFEEAGRVYDERIRQAYMQRDVAEAQRLEDEKLSMQNKAFALNAPIATVTEGALGVVGQLPGLLRRAAAPTVVRAGLRAVGREAAEGVAREAVQEGAEQLLSNVAASYTYDPNRKLSEGVGESMLYGGLGGGVIAGATSGARELISGSRFAGLDREIERSLAERQNRDVALASLDIAAQSRSALSLVDAELANTQVQNPAQAQAVFARGLAEKLRIATEYVDASRNLPQPVPVPPPAPAPVFVPEPAAIPAAPQPPRMAPEIVAPDAGVGQFVEARGQTPFDALLAANRNQEARRSRVAAGLTTPQEPSTLAANLLSAGDAEAGLAQVVQPEAFTPFDQALRTLPPLQMQVPSDVNRLWSTANKAASDYMSGADVDPNLIAQLDEIAPQIVRQLDNRIQSAMNAGVPSSQIEPYLKISEQLSAFIREYANEKALRNLNEQERYSKWLESAGQQQQPTPAAPSAAPASQPAAPAPAVKAPKAQVAAKPAAQQVPAPEPGSFNAPSSLIVQTAGGTVEATVSPGGLSETAYTEIYGKPGGFLDFTFKGPGVSETGYKAVSGFVYAGKMTKERAEKMARNIAEGRPAEEAVVQSAPKASRKAAPAITTPAAAAPVTPPQPTTTPPSNAIQVSEPGQSVLGNQAAQPEVQVELPGVGEQDAQVRAAIEEVAPDATLIDSKLKRLGLDRFTERFTKVKDALVKAVKALKPGKKPTPAQLAKRSASAVRQIQFELEDHRRQLVSKSIDDLFAELGTLIPKLGGTTTQSRIDEQRALQVTQELINRSLPLKTVAERAVESGGDAAIQFIQRAAPNLQAKKAPKETEVKVKKTEENRKWWTQDPVILDLDNLTVEEAERVSWDRGDKEDRAEPPETNRTKLIKYMDWVRTFIDEGAAGRINDLVPEKMGPFRDRIYDLVMGEVVSDYKEQTANGGEWDIKRGYAVATSPRGTLSKAAYNIFQSQDFKDLKKEVSDTISSEEGEDLLIADVASTGESAFKSGPVTMTEEAYLSEEIKSTARSVLEEMERDKLSRDQMQLLHLLGVRESFGEDEFEERLDNSRFKLKDLEEPRIKQLYNEKYKDLLINLHRLSRAPVSVPLPQNEVQSAITAAFGSLPPNVTVINDPAHVLPDGQSGENVGAYVNIATGEIVVNAAFIDSERRAVEAVVEEMVHLVFLDPKVREEWGRVLRRVTAEDMQAKINAGYSADQAREEAAVEKVLEYLREKSNDSTIGKFIDTLWSKLKEIFKLSNEYDKDRNAILQRAFEVQKRVSVAVNKSNGTLVLNSSGEAVSPLVYAPAEYTNGRGTVSTRKPTVKDAPESDVVLQVNLDAVNSTANQKKSLKRNIAKGIRDGVVRSDSDTRYLADADASGTDDQVIRSFIDLTKGNLKWLWNSFPEQLRERAKLWYVGANKIADAAAEQYNLTTEQAAGVFAVLSPQKDWFQNVSMGERVMQIWNRAKTENFLFTPELFDYVFQADIEELKTTSERVYVRREFKEKKWSTRSGIPEQEFIAQENQRRSEHNNKERQRKKKIESAAAEARLKLNDKEAAWTALSVYVGKRWNELPLDGRARLFRALDETTNDRSYRIILPEGGRGAVALTTKGNPSIVAWSSYNFIAKALSILDNGDIANISIQLGDEHKVRNFFNNISDPYNPNGYVTIDTHAVAAALLNALSGESEEVKDNFGAAGSDGLVGISGTYGVYAEAYKELANELSQELGRPVLAREVQSVTWEAIRLLFPKEEKTSGELNKKLDAVWKEYADGKRTIDDVRSTIWNLSGGIRNPSWANTDFGFDAQQGSVAAGVPDGGPFIPLGRRAASLNSELPSRGSSGIVSGIVRGNQDVAADVSSKPDLRLSRSSGVFFNTTQAAEAITTAQARGADATALTSIAQAQGSLIPRTALDEANRLQFGSKSDKRAFGLLKGLRKIGELGDRGWLAAFPTLNPSATLSSEMGDAAELAAEAVVRSDLGLRKTRESMSKRLEELKSQMADALADIPEALNKKLDAELALSAANTLVRDMQTFLANQIKVAGTTANAKIRQQLTEASRTISERKRSIGSAVGSALTNITKEMPASIVDKADMVKWIEDRLNDTSQPQLMSDAARAFLFTRIKGTNVVPFYRIDIVELINRIREVQKDKSAAQTEIAALKAKLGGKGPTAKRFVSEYENLKTQYKNAINVYREINSRVDALDTKITALNKAISVMDRAMQDVAYDLRLKDAIKLINASPSQMKIVYGADGNATGTITVPNPLDKTSVTIDLTPNPVKVTAAVKQLRELLAAHMTAIGDPNTDPYDVEQLVRNVPQLQRLSEGLAPWLLRSVISEKIPLIGGMTMPSLWEMKTKLPFYGSRLSTPNNILGWIGGPLQRTVAGLVEALDVTDLALENLRSDPDRKRPSQERIDETMLTAMKAHGMDPANQEEQQRWTQFINRIIGQNQNAESVPFKVGDNTIFGLVVMPEDLAAAEAQKAYSKAVFQIGQKAPKGSILRNLFERPLLQAEEVGGRVILRASADYGMKMSRTVSMDNIPIVRDWVRATSPAEKVGLLTDHFTEIVLGMVTESNPEFKSVISRQDKAIFAELIGMERAGTIPFTDVDGFLDWWADERAAVSGNSVADERVEVEKSLISYVDDMMGKLGEAHSAGKVGTVELEKMDKRNVAPATIVAALSADNQFTKARGELVAPSTFYRYDLSGIGAQEIFKINLLNHLAAEQLLGWQNLLAAIRVEMNRYDKRKRELMKTMTESQAIRKLQIQSRKAARTITNESDYASLRALVTSIEAMNFEIGRAITEYVAVPDDMPAIRTTKSILSLMASSLLAGTSPIVNNVTGAAVMQSTVASSLRRQSMLAAGPKVILKMIKYTIGRSLASVAKRVKWFNDWLSSTRGLGKALGSVMTEAMFQRANAINALTVNVPDVGTRMRMQAALPGSSGYLDPGRPQHTVTTFVSMLQSGLGIPYLKKVFPKAMHPYIDAAAKALLGIQETAKREFPGFFDRGANVVGGQMDRDYINAPDLLDNIFKALERREKSDPNWREMLTNLSPAEMGRPAAGMKLIRDLLGAIVPFERAALDWYDRTKGMSPADRIATPLLTPDQEDQFVLNALKLTNQRTVSTTPPVLKGKGVSGLTRAVFGMFARYGINMAGVMARRFARVQGDDDNRDRLMAGMMLALVIAVLSIMGLEVKQLFNYIQGEPRNSLTIAAATESPNAAGRYLSSAVASQIPWGGEALQQLFGGTPASDPLDLTRNVPALSQANALYKAARQIIQTGDVTYAAADLIRSMVPASKMALNVMMPGDALRREAARSVRLNAPSDIELREFGGGGGRATPMQPLIRSAINSAFTGDTAGYNKAVQKAVEYQISKGKTREQAVKTVNAAIAAKDPIMSVVGRKLSDADVERITRTMTGSQRQSFLKARSIAAAAKPTKSVGRRGGLLRGSARRGSLLRGGKRGKKTRRPSLLKTLR